MENTITIPKKEYDLLKKYQREAATWRQYLRHLRDIKRARQDIAEGRILPAEEVYKQLGLE
jgi:hypothetical protein